MLLLIERVRMNVITAIVDSGTAHLKDNFLNTKIKTANFTAVFFGVLSIPFTIFTYILIPPLAILPILFFVLCMLAIFLNRLALYHISRLILSIGLMSIFSWYECLILPDDQPLISSFYALHLMFLLPSWLIFDTREKGLLIPSVSITVLITLSLSILNNWFSYDVNPDVIQSFKDGWLSYLLYTTSIVGLSGGLFFLGYQNYQAEIEKDHQLEKTKQASLELLENEKATKRYLEDLERSKKEDAKRSWTSNGLAEFALLLQLNNDNFQSTFDKVISRLIHYLKVTQGGIFVLNEENDFELTSMYAYERKKYTHKIIKKGEGLIGQVVLEKETLYLTQVPANYINITSGLGGAPPKCILIVPLLINDVVYGVIEIASLTLLEDFEIEFVNQVGKNMANTIAQFKSTNQTNTLLEKFQVQAQELSAQQEEMRQNMEELESIQEEMIRKEKEYIKRITELEK